MEVSIMKGLSKALWKRSYVYTPHVYLVPDGGGELLDKAPGGSGGEESVVAEHDPEAAQPTDLPKVPEEVEVGDACRG